MTKQKKIILSSGSVFFVIVVLNLLMTNWPAAVFQLPLTVYDRPRSADVVIVLGAGARKHGQPLPPQAKERIQQGYSLLQQGYAPTMIVAGGLSKQSGLIEADLMKAYAISIGLPSEQIVVENRSINTWENAVNALDIMKRNNWESALVVTSPYHTLRACTIFHKLRAEVKCIAAPLSLIPTDSVYERLTDFRSVIREYGAIVYFVFKHYL